MAALALDQEVLLVAEPVATADVPEAAPEEPQEDGADPGWVGVDPISAGRAVAVGISKNSSRRNSPPICRRPPRCQTPRSLWNAVRQLGISARN